MDEIERLALNTTIRNVRSHEQRIRQLEKKMTQSNSDIDKLNADVEGLTQAEADEEAQLTQVLNGMQAQVNDLEAQIQALKSANVGPDLNKAISSIETAVQGIKARTQSLATLLPGGATPPPSDTLPSGGGGSGGVTPNPDPNPITGTVGGDIPPV